MTTIIVDMSNQPAGDMFAASTDWYYACDEDRLDVTLEAFKVLGIPARVEYELHASDWDPIEFEFPDDAIVSNHASKANHLLVTWSNGV